jgi:hypothetical protein
VRIDLGKVKGKIIIEFATIDDLHRIMRTIKTPKEQYIDK